MNLLLNTLRRATPDSPTAAPPLDSPADIGAICEDPCAEQLIRSGAYCRLLNSRQTEGWADDAIQAADQAMQREMAFVPPGTSQLQAVGANTLQDPGAPFQPAAEVEDAAFFVDRLAVTNQQYQHFVNAGGYRQEELWPAEILPLVFQFVDQSGSPGPRFWQEGRAAAGREHHPVVGVCWFEAQAYATWAGKRLPTGSQWQRAGCWWQPNVRHPWGNSFERTRANTVSMGIGDTLPVDAMPDGATPNGVQQLVGNVWEWTFSFIESVQIDGQDVPLHDPLAETRGGAFDTYLAAQANCLFRSGYPLLHRGHNVGFRCCQQGE